MDAEKNFITSHVSDHDLIVTIHGQVNRAITDIKELKDNVADRVNKLEDGKVNKSEITELKLEADKLHADYEKRLRRLESYGAILIGLSYALQFYFNYLRR